MSSYVSYLVIWMRKEDVVFRVPMSSYLSYLVIWVHKEDDALPRCFPFDLFRRNRHPK
jgi:hypothetical protein